MILIRLLVAVFGSCFLFPLMTSSQMSSIECGEDLVRIRLSSTDLDLITKNESKQIIISPEISPSNVSSQCITTRSNGTFNITLNDCDPEITLDQILIKFTWFITLNRTTVSSNFIQRSSDLVITLSCQFNAQQIISSPSIKADKRELAFLLSNQFSEFNVHLQLFEDSPMQRPFQAGQTLIVPSPIFARVSANSNLHVQMRECWATPTNVSSDPRRYPIIINGCAANNIYDISNDINVTRNFQPATGSFSFRSFVWLTNVSQAIYVHCRIETCDQRSGASCNNSVCPPPNTSKKKRRSLDGGKEFISSYGPIRLQTNKIEEMMCKINGRCSENCILSFNHVVCACADGTILTHSKAICSESLFFKFGFERINKHIPIYVIMLLAMLVCSLLISKLLCANKKYAHFNLKTSL